MLPKYEIKLMFEWGGGSIWCGNKAAFEKFDVGPIEEALGLSVATLSELNQLSAWHDKSLDWDYPPAPSPWSKEELSRFEEAAKALHIKIQNELGAEFKVIYVSL